MTCPGGAVSRRDWLGTALATAGLAGVTVAFAGCGFQRRQTPTLPFSRIALAGFAAASPMAEALREALSAQARVLDDPAQAEVVLSALRDTRNKTVAASTATGQVREFRLQLLLRFRLHLPDGRELIAPTEIEQVRDLSYSETAALSKEQEAALLERDMQADIVSQVLRMLAKVRPPG